MAYGGDNMVVRNWLRSRNSRIRGGRLLISVINAVQMRWSCQILSDADFVTRCTAEAYGQFAEEQKLRVVDVKAAVFQALEDSEKFGLTFTHQADEGDRNHLLHLKERRVRRQIQSDLSMHPGLNERQWAGGSRTSSWPQDHCDEEKTFVCDPGPGRAGETAEGVLVRSGPTGRLAGHGIEGPKIAAWELGRDGWMDGWVDGWMDR